MPVMRTVAINRIAREATNKFGFDDIEESNPGSTDRVLIRSAIAWAIQEWEREQGR